METPIKIVNLKYNVPLLNGMHFAVLGTTFFIIGTILHLFVIYVYATMEDKMIPYQTYVYRIFFLESILFSLVLPIWIRNDSGKHTIVNWKNSSQNADLCNEVELKSI